MKQNAYLLSNLKLQQALSTNSLVKRFYSYPEINSTMSQARRLVGGATASHFHGTLLVADHQTGGKGRHGRTWSAPAGTSLLATLILARTELPGDADAIQLSLLASAVPVAVCRGVADFIPAVRIKYPNDIVVGGRKLGGILIEAVGDAVFVGFGINCSQDLEGLPSEIRMPASSVFLETGLLIPRETILQSILHCMEEILKPKLFFTSVDHMNELCETLGRVLCIDIGDDVLTGVPQSIAADGTLVLDTDAGQETIYSSQVVRTWFPDETKERV